MKKKLAASGDLYFALPANFLFPLRQFYKLSTSVDTFLDMILQHKMTNDYHISEKKWLNNFNRDVTKALSLTLYNQQKNSI